MNGAIRISLYQNRDKKVFLRGDICIKNGCYISVMEETNIIASIDRIKQRLNEELEAKKAEEEINLLVPSPHILSFPVYIESEIDSYLSGEENL